MHYLSSFLARRGHVVIIAQEGHLGRSVVVGRHHGIIVVDAESTDWAVACCKRLRARTDDLPSSSVILVSSADEASALAAGFDDFIGKPYEEDVLYARIDSHVRRCARYSNGSAAFFDVHTRRVAVGSRNATLSPVECRILARLLHEEGQFVRRGDLAPLYGASSSKAERSPSTSLGSVRNCSRSGLVRSWGHMARTHLCRTRRVRWDSTMVRMWRRQSQCHKICHSISDACLIAGSPYHP
jgi:DNA-binding response OmpR family regulator